MDWVPLAITSVVSIVASSGFWTYLQQRDKSKESTTRLLMGVAYDKITTLGIAYIERGWVTTDEYDDLNKYFFLPYKELGGNGTAERIMHQVRRLPMNSHHQHPAIFHNNQPGGIHNVQLVTRGQVNPGPPV